MLPDVRDKRSSRQRALPEFNLAPTVAAGLVALTVCALTACSSDTPASTDNPSRPDNPSRSTELTPTSSPSEPAGLPPLPRGWPETLQLGLSDGPGGAVAMRETAPYGFRYQYLAGGVNTGNGWATWSGNGQFVTEYIRDSVSHGIVPVFTYYMVFQSAPGNNQDESGGVITNLQNVDTMTAYYNDLKLFFQRAAAFPSEIVVLHLEPDLWGFTQQHSRNGEASSIPVEVASTALPGLADLPDDLSGFARAVVRLRDTYAPNVRLAYHLSIWAAGEDFTYTDASLARVESLAERTATFYRSLHTEFDLVFAEFSDRDAGFKEHAYGDGGASWWDEHDFARHIRFLATFVDATGKRIVLWQIPFGNTRMRALNNTPDHYQDNRVQWLLDDPSRDHLSHYVQAGVIAFLFGRGAGGTTCACDAANDGVTNPPPINGNTGESLNTDDDGGFFRQKAREYYDAGAMPLPLGAN